MSRAYYTDVTNLGDGVNDYSRPDLIGQGETPNTARNIRGEAESFKPRKGYTIFADERASATVKALGSWTRNSSANDKLVRITSDNKLWTINPDTDSTWTEISTSSLLTSSDNVTFSGYGEWLFIFNGVDKPLQVEGTTVTQPFTAPASVSTANFVPAFGEVYNGSLFVAGVPTAPNVVFVSQTASAANPEDVYDFSGALTGFGNADELKFPERVTAIRKLSTALVIFTLNDAYYIPGLATFGSTVTFDVQPIGGAAGAISHRSTAVVENDIFYITPQKEIKSVRRGFSDNLSIITSSLSTKIQKYLNDNIDSNLSSAFAYYDEPNKLYKLYLKESTSSVNNIRIVGDIDKLDQNGIPPLYIDDQMYFDCGVYYKTDGLQQSYIGSNIVGQVFSDEVGLADNDTSIITFRSTKSYNANNPTTQKNWREVVFYGEMTETSEITFTVYVDNIEVASETLTSADLPTGSTTLDGGIGTDDIGDFAIGEEGGDILTEYDQMKEFVKRITFRQRGKRMRIDVSTDGVNNNYRIRHLTYAFIPTSKLFNPVIEK